MPTSGNAEEILSGGAVDLDVTLAEVVLMTTERQASVFSTFETNQSFAIAPALLAETESHSASVRRRSVRETELSVYCSSLNSKRHRIYSHLTATSVSHL